MNPTAVGSAGPPVAAAQLTESEKGRGEQSVVSKGGCLAGDRLGAVHCLQAVRPRATSGNQIGYSDFLEEVRNKHIKSVTLQESPGGGTEIIALTTDDKRLRSTATYLDRVACRRPHQQRRQFDVKPREEPSILMSILVS